MAGSLRETNRRLLSSDPNELCDRLKLLLQQKQSGNNSYLIIAEIVSIAE